MVASQSPALIVSLDMFTGPVNLNFTIQNSSSSWEETWYLPNPSSSQEEIWYAAAAAALLVLLVVACFVYSLSFKKKKEIIAHKERAQEDNDEKMILEADVKYAAELQVQEDLAASKETNISDVRYAAELQVQEDLLASQKTNISPSLCSLLKNEKKRVGCNICLEMQMSWQMFRNSTCSHSFCYDCTTKYATTKMQEKNKTIVCPGSNCGSTLDDKILRLFIPKETIIKWDEFLCESLIPASQKLYCPFANCSVLLINDNTSITKINCPVCQRKICAACRVPWHSEFSCKEFGKLKVEEDDEMAVLGLAKKKRWRKCPNCNFFVEKVSGCSHILCRCKYHFCYDCGGKWSSTHYGCELRCLENKPAQ